jgi:hypothetical protein
MPAHRQSEPRDPLARQFRRSAQHHAAAAGAGEHDIVQIFVEHQVGDLSGLRGDGDARAQHMTSLATAIE